MPGWLLLLRRRLDSYTTSGFTRFIQLRGFCNRNTVFAWIISTKFSKLNMPSVFGWLLL
jgi:hypothetical protein